MSKGDADKQAEATEKRRIAGRRRMLPADVERIVLIVRNWPALPMTWEAICDAVAREIRETDKGRKIGLAPWSRQALSKHAAIKKAYDTRRTELQDEATRGVGRKKRPQDAEAAMLRNQVDALKREKADLEAKVAEYEEIFATMAHNKALGAITQDDMVVPLKPKMDRKGRDK